jgi:glycosyltransferase involved in cell wall biosynthesis
MSINPKAICKTNFNPSFAHITHYHLSDSVVIIPTYNEIGNIEKMVRKVFSLSKEFHLLIIDDGSPDGTAQKVKDLQSEFNGRLFIIERKGKLGLGTAYIAGFPLGFGKIVSVYFRDGLRFLAQSGRFDSFVFGMHIRNCRCSRRFTLCERGRLS